MIQNKQIKICDKMSKNYNKNIKINYKMLLVKNFNNLKLIKIIAILDIMILIKLLFQRLLI